jgi:formylglycine-generating enzyme required for sulfatase activity
MRSECNTDQSQIGHTSAVGLFPGGDTQKENGNEWGVSDLTGNAWEWTRTLWSEDLEHQEVVIDQLPVGRVLISRGGSWRFGEFRFPRLISPLRRGFAPHDRYDDLGFRLVYTGDEILDGRNERHL